MAKLTLNQLADTIEIKIKYVMIILYVWRLIYSGNEITLEFNHETVLVKDKNKIFQVGLVNQS